MKNAKKYFAITVLILFALSFVVFKLGQDPGRTIASPPQPVDDFQKRVRYPR